MAGHGLGNPWTVRILLDLVCRCKPDFVFLMEVKVCSKEINNGGGLFLVWKENTVQLRYYAKNFIDVEIHILGMTFFITVQK